MVISHFSSRALLLLTGTVWWSSLTSHPVHSCCSLGPVVWWSSLNSHPVHCCSLGPSGGHLSPLTPCTAAAAQWNCLVVISHLSTRALLLLTGTVWWSSLTSDHVQHCYETMHCLRFDRLKGTERKRHLSIGAERINKHGAVFRSISGPVC